MTHTKTKLFTHNFLLLSLIYFCLTIVSFLLNTIIVLYATEQYNVSPGIGGLISGIFVLGGLTGRLLSEPIERKFNRKLVSLLFFFLFIATTGLYVIHFGILFFMFNRLIHGFAFGVISNQVGTLVTLIIPPSRKGEGISYYSMFGTLATAFGPFIGLLLRKHYGFNAVFVFCLIVAILGIIATLFLQFPKADETSSYKYSVPSKKESFIESSALSASVIIFIVAFCYSSVLSYMNLYAAEIHLESAATFFFLCYGIAVLCTRPISGALLDRKGPHVIMIPAFIIFGIGMILLGSASSSFTFLLSSIFLGIGFGNIQSCTQVLSIQSAPLHRVGVATATFFIFFEAATGLGPIILGTIISDAGYSLLYIVLGIIGMLTIIPYALFFRKTNNKKI